MPSLTILVVEDNPITAKMMRVALHAEGYRVLNAQDGGSALKLFASQPPDVALLDFGLPDMTGSELCHRLRQTPGGAAIPILGMSAYLPSGAEGERIRRDFTDFLFKPINLSYLLQILEGFTGPGAPAAETAGAGRRLLVVDDDAIQLRLLRITFESAGYQVIACQDGQRAIEEARAHPPDAVISDVLMPGVDGFGICLALRKDPRFARTPILLISSVFHEHEDRCVAASVGASRLLTRPLPRRALQETLATCLRSGTAAPMAAPPGPVPTAAELQTTRFNHLVELSVAQARRLSLLETGLGILASAADAIDTSTSETDILNQVIPRCLNAAGLSRAAMYLLDPEGNPTLAGHFGFPDARHDALAGMLGAPDLFVKAAQLREPVQLRLELTQEAAERAALERAGVNSLALAPVTIGDQCLGVLLIATEDREWSREWHTIAVALGAQLGQMIAFARELSSSRQRSRSLMEHANDAIFVLDGEGAILEVNRRAEELTGLRAAELCGRLCVDLTAPADRDRARAEFERLFQATFGIAEAIEVLRPDGTSRWVDFSLSVIAVGRPLVLSIGRDVTERRRAEQELRESQEKLRQAAKMEAVGLLAGGVAHDFNNLLSAICGFSDLLLLQLPPQDPLREYAAVILQAGDSAAALTRQLLAFGRKQILQPEVLDLSEVIGNLHKLLRRTIREDIDLVTVVAPAVGRVRADRSQVEQVVMNLAVNARDAMPHGGKLTLEIRNFELDEKAARALPNASPGPYVAIAVSDTGTGMSPATLKHIFEPFFTTKEPGKGTGLGLATVHGIVHQSGGHLLVESELGHGTRFTLRFPRVAEEQLPVRPHQTPASGARATETVLLVEDEPLVRALARETLSGAGYRVLEAGFPEEALRLEETERGTIHLLLTDIIMPGMGGRELAQRLVARRAGLRVVFMSGYPGGAVESGSVAAPLPEFIQKPFGTGVLLRKVREALDRETP